MRGKIVPLTVLDEDMDLEATVSFFNTAVIETTSEILEKHCCSKNP